MANPSRCVWKKTALCLRELDSGRSRRFVCKDLAKPELYEHVPCACSAAGQSLAVADEQSRVHIWDTATGRQRCVLPFKNAYIPELAFSPDGRILASLLRDEGVQLGGRVQLWDAGTGKALHTLARDQTFLRSVVFTSDGKTLATARGSEVRFWDVATGRERGHTQCQTHLAANIALSPDGKWLVTAAYHGSAFHVWDVASGKRRAEPESHTNRPFGTAFSPDGRRVATGGTSDSTFRIWNLSTGMPLLRIGRGGIARRLCILDGRAIAVLNLVQRPAMRVRRRVGRTTARYQVGRSRTSGHLPIGHFHVSIQRRQDAGCVELLLRPHKTTARTTQH